MKLAGAAAAMIPFAMVHGAWAVTIHVPADLPTIQAGIDAAVEGDTVAVACGTYYEHDILLSSGVTLRGVSGEPDCVVIDAQQQGRVLIGQGLSESTVIEGLTLTRGFTSGTYPRNTGGGLYLSDSCPTIRRCVFEQNACGTGGLHVGGGGGLNCERSSPAIVECVFSHNFTADHIASGHGAALRCRFASSRPSIHDSVFLENSATPLDTGVGGAFFSMDGASPIFVNCEFTRNTAYGAGVGAAEQGSPEFLSCTFDGNTALYYAGALYLGGDGLEVSLAECVFRDNVQIRATTDAGASWGGGAINLLTGRMTVLNCSFVGNRAARRSGALNVHGAVVAVSDCSFAENVGREGGALYGDHCEVTFDGCTMKGNVATLAGGAIYSLDSGITLRGSTLVGQVVETSGNGSAIAATQSTISVAQSIVSAGSGGDVFTCSGPVVAVVTCTDIFGNDEGDWTGCISGLGGVSGNLAADALFCDPDHGDFTLSSDSPCLPGNHPEGVDCGLIGAFGPGCGPVSVAQDTWAGVKSRYRLSVR